MGTVFDVYFGDDDYIFVSYAHKNSSDVLSILKNMSDEGYRIWYDEGIDPGSEWPEFIAQRLNSCSVCIAFISKDSLQSDNCRKEINFAISHHKVLVVVYLESVTKTLGMEMQLDDYQSIRYYEYDSVGLFLNKLYECKYLKNCKKTSSGAPSGDIGNAKKPRLISKKSVGTFSLLRQKTGIAKSFDADKITIGRSIAHADYVIGDNSAVGRNHAFIIRKNGKLFVVDNNSANGTQLNSQPLTAYCEYELTNGDVLLFANEKIIVKFN